MRRDRSASSPVRWSVATTTPFGRPSGPRMRAAAWSRSPPLLSVSIERVSTEPLRACAARRSAAARLYSGGSVGAATFTTGSGPSRAPRPCADPVDLDHLHPLLRDVGREPIANRADVGGGQIDARQRSRHAVGLIGHQLLALVVVVARNPIGPCQDFVHRRVEPPVDVRPNQLAADQEHDNGRHERHSQQQRHQLRAEPREGQAAPPFDDKLDDVARQDEHQRDQHREICGRQRVQNEFGQKIRREPRTAVGDGHNRHQRGDEHGDTGQDQFRIVTKPASPGRRGREGRPAGASRRDRRDGSRHFFSFQLSVTALSSSPLLRHSAKLTADS